MYCIAPVVAVIIVMLHSNLSVMLSSLLVTYSVYNYVAMLIDVKSNIIVVALSCDHVMLMVMRLC